MRARGDHQHAVGAAPRGRPDQGAHLGAPLRLICILVVLAGITAHAAPADEADRLDALLDAWAVSEAAPQIAELLERAPQDGRVLRVAGKLAFLQGEYERASKLLERARSILPVEDDFLLERVRATLTAARRMRVVEHGRFRFLIASDSPDGILVGYAAEALEAQIAALTSDLGWRPEGRLRVEFLPDTQTLSRFTGLDTEAIETSSTIAVAKWNKLMVTSPRAALRGYSWRTTVCHELTHLALAQLSRNRAPLWLQEGMAKMLDGRHEQTLEQITLDPRARHLLALAVKSDRLIPFSRMRPSFAYLPSEESMALAFGQVWTLVRMMYEEQGTAGLRRLLSLMAEGKSEDEALAAVYGGGFDVLADRWQSYLRKQRFEPLARLAHYGLEFAPRGADADKRERARIKEKRVRDHLTLGDLLYARRRVRAASVEYGRAAKQSQLAHPLVQRRLARTLTETGRRERAAEILEQTLELYPNHPAVLVDRGELALAAGNRVRALEIFETVIGIHPFDPRPHAALARLHADAGQAVLARREREVLRVLQYWLEER